MAQTPEAKVKVFIDSYMKTNFEGCWRYPAPGGMFGNGGVPDRLYLYKGVFIAIEAKADSVKPTALQWAQLHKISEQGGVAAVVTGKDLNKMNMIRDTILRRLKP